MPTEHIPNVVTNSSDFKEKGKFANYGFGLTIPPCGFRAVDMRRCS